ncbi:putative plant AUGMIN subunit 7 protein [Helianthus anomalus]
MLHLNLSYLPAWSVIDFSSGCFSSNFVLLGDKSSFSQQNVQGDVVDRDEETSRIQCM